MLRYEYKYIISIEHLDEVRRQLAPYMVPDAHAGRNGGDYTVRSIYFDTPDFECYTSKLAGIKHRKKLRVRGYNLEAPANTVFLEIKKKYEDPILKYRTPLPFNRLEDVFEDQALDILDPKARVGKPGESMKRFLYHIYAGQMHPVVTVIYEREAFESRFPNPQNNLRITLDKNLRSVAYPGLENLYSEAGALPVMEDRFIMEIKFNQEMPQWAAKMTGYLGVKRRAASKYCMCIDAHPRIVPQNRFDSVKQSKPFR